VHVGRVLCSVRGLRAGSLLHGTRHGRHNHAPYKGQNH
jgi:hypothetical protein